VRTARMIGVMTQQTRELMQKALALPEGERMALIRVLIESLDDATEEDVERAWNEEISRRITDLDSGRARTISWNEVQQRITARLEHGK
jgi:putative addiction module component (TIGR02574 family)